MLFYNLHALHEFVRTRDIFIGPAQPAIFPRLCFKYCTGNLHSKSKRDLNKYTLYQLLKSKKTKIIFFFFFFFDFAHYLQYLLLRLLTADDLHLYFDSFLLICTSFVFRAGDNFFMLYTCFSVWRIMKTLVSGTWSHGNGNLRL